MKFALRTLPLTWKLHQKASPAAWVDALHHASAPRTSSWPKLDRVRRSVHTGWARGGLHTSQAISPAFERLGTAIGKQIPWSIERWKGICHQTYKVGALFDARFMAWMADVAVSPACVAACSLATHVGRYWQPGDGRVGAFVREAADVARALLKVADMQCSFVAALHLNAVRIEAVRGALSPLGMVALQAYLLIRALPMVYYIAASSLPILLTTSRWALCQAGAAAGSMVGLATGLHGCAQEAWETPQLATPGQQAGLHSMPPELIMQMAAQLDVRDATALASTSRTFSALGLRQEAVKRGIADANNVFPAAILDASGRQVDDPAGVQAAILEQLPNTKFWSCRWTPKAPASTSPLFRHLQVSESITTDVRVKGSPVCANGHLFAQSDDGAFRSSVVRIDRDGSSKRVGEVTVGAARRLKSFGSGLFSLAHGGRLLESWDVDHEGELHAKPMLDTQAAYHTVVGHRGSLFVASRAESEAQPDTLCAFTSERKLPWRRAWKKNVFFDGNMRPYADSLFFTESGSVNELDQITGALLRRYDVVANLPNSVRRQAPGFHNTPALAVTRSAILCESFLTDGGYTLIPRTANYHLHLVSSYTFPDALDNAFGLWFRKIDSLGDNFVSQGISSSAILPTSAIFSKYSNGTFIENRDSWYVNAFLLGDRLVAQVLDRAGSRHVKQIIFTPRESFPAP